ncbi:hypothetical protein GCM10023324_20410 [Streptomyces youssoufiensis]
MRLLVSDVDRVAHLPRRPGSGHADEADGRAIFINPLVVAVRSSRAARTGWPPSTVEYVAEPSKRSGGRHAAVLFRVLAVAYVGLGRGREP